MKVLTTTTYIERCYLCPRMSMSSEYKTDMVERTFVCMELERVIDTAYLMTSNRKYKKKPILHQAGWFPEWCPLEDK